MATTFNLNTLVPTPSATASTFDDSTAATGASDVQSAIVANDARLDVIEGADPINIFDGLLT